MKIKEKIKDTPDRIDYAIEILEDVIDQLKKLKKLSTGEGK